MRVWLIGLVLLLAMPVAALGDDDMAALKMDVLRLEAKCRALELKVAELTKRLDALTGVDAARAADAAEGDSVKEAAATDATVKSAEGRRLANKKRAEAEARRPRSRGRGRDSRRLSVCPRANG